MPRHQSASAYTQERHIWNLAMQEGLFRIECGTHNAAIAQVQRLNQCRIALRKRAYEEHKANPVGPIGSIRRMTWEMEVDNMEAQWTPEDMYVVRRHGSQVVIEKRQPLFVAAFGADGRAITIPRATAPRMLRSMCMTDEGRLFLDDDGNPIPGNAPRSDESYNPNAPASDAPLDLETNEPHSTDREQ